MKQDSSTRSWNGIGGEWIELAQKNDFRVGFIMPVTLEKLGDVRGKRIIDIGGGEGGYSRELTKRGASVTCVDCSEIAIAYAMDKAREEGLELTHIVGNSADLRDIPDEKFDIALCSMMLMDCEDLTGTLSEAARVLVPGGKLFASALHPCFNGKDTRWLGDDDEKHVDVQNYFEPCEWRKPITRGASNDVIWRHRTLEEYMSAFTAANFKLTHIYEPQPTEEQLSVSPRIGWLKRIPMYIFWEAVKE